jgi:single-strand DNA-binding protein
LSTPPTKSLLQHLRCHTLESRTANALRNLIEETAVNETFVTVVGNIATTPKGMKLENGDTVVDFRIASNERRRNGPGGDWGRGDSLFIRVTCWRRLAENVLASFDLGDPVIVRGRLYTDEYEWDGKSRAEMRLEAATVGPDLTRCTAQITRNRRKVAVAVGDGVEESIDADESTGPVPAGERSWPPDVAQVELDGAPNGSAAEHTDDDRPSDDQLDLLVAGAEAAVGA